MSKPAAPPAPSRPSLLILTITYLAFISLGLPDSVLGVAWPSIRETLKLPLEAVGILTLVQTLVSASASFFSGNLAKRFSTGPIIIVSSLISGSALLVLASAPSFVFLMLAVIPLGLGGGSVDSGLNAYVAKHYSSRHMNWLHSFWGGGATLGPLVMTTALGIGVGWRGGYLWIALVQLSLAFLFFLTLPLWKRNESLTEAQSVHGESPKGTLGVRSWAAWVSVLFYIFYSAAEMGAGLWANSVMIESRGIPAATAGIWVAAFFGAIMAGRITVGIVVVKWGNRKLIVLGLVLALVGALCFGLGAWVQPLSLVGLIFMGLGFAPVYPCQMHETPRRFTAEAAPVVIGRQVGGAYIGGAFLPGLTGWVLSHASLEALAPIVGGVILVLLILSFVLNRKS